MEQRGSLRDAHVEIVKTRDKHNCLHGVALLLRHSGAGALGNDLSQ